MEQFNGMAASTITVINGTAAFFGEIQRLCDERYGTGYICREDYDRWLKNPELFKIALIEGDFAGFAVMLPAGVSEVMKHMGMPEQDVRRISGNKPALIYKSAAVQKKYEHRGVMKAMAAEGIRQARRLGYGSLYGSAWVYDGQVPIEGTFRAFGFQRLYARHMLWYGNENYRCVVCKGRCTCDAMIYYKIL